jgi:solute carrier family 25 S-adenosylmethionine transporter 26
VAEALSCAIITPAEVIKQNAQVLSGSSKQSSSLQSFAKFSSASQLWRGYTALVMRNLPFTALQYPLFEHLRTKFHDHRLKDGVRHTVQDTAKETALAASIAGSLSAWFTTPVDVVKTRIMLAASEKARKKAFDVAKQILRSEGIHGLYQGALLRGIWTGLGSGLYLGSYEVGKRLLRERRQPDTEL